MSGASPSRAPRLPFVAVMGACAMALVGHLAVVNFRASPAAEWVFGAMWLALAWGAVVVLVKRVRVASAPARRMVAPLLLSCTLYALSVVVLLVIAQALPSRVVSLGWMSLAVALAIPCALLLGLTWERLFMGNALAGLVAGLSDASSTDLQTLMAQALHDPSLRIVYRRPHVASYVDPEGAPVAMPAHDPHLAFTTIEREGRPVAVIIHDAELLDQRRYIEAAGAAGLIWLQNAQLAADLKASMVDLAASRRRLVEAADVERQRIERDLHDGAQQHLVGMRLRLELAAEAIHEDPARGERMLGEIGEQMDETLEDLRGLAQGVYPPLLPEHGLLEAIRAASRRSPFPGTVAARGIGRYAPDTETAVYFCCLEALQNVAKHAGPHVGGTVRLWEEGPRLCFEVRDEGAGFAVESVKPGSGLVNMRDRMEAAGGTLVVSSRAGEGTAVRGSVPIAAAGVDGARTAGGAAGAINASRTVKPTQERSYT